MTIHQSPPYTVKIELSEGCNLACDFCGINGIREKPGKIYNFMTVETARAIAQQLWQLVTLDKWNPHIEFTMHGEPTMNPHHPEIIAILREHLPKTQLMLTSNGGGLLKGDTAGHINALFLKSGLNILALDDYDGVHIVSKIRDRTLLDLNPAIRWYEYPADKDGHPHKRRNVQTRMVTVIADIKKNTKNKEGTHSHLSNHCGAAAPKDLSTMGRKCARPFRELAIRWNGEVAACCDDWRGQYKIGNIHTQPIGQLWQNDRFVALRKKLYLGQRNFGPCEGCNSRSYRVGLLPDPMGKQTMSPINKGDLDALQQAIRGPSLASIVLRKWERKDTDDVLG